MAFDHRFCGRIRHHLCGRPGFDHDVQAREPRRHEMNPTMAGMMGTFQIVWVYYGFLIDSMPVVIWNIIAVGINFLIVGAFFYFTRKEKMGRPEARSHG